jgi:DNA-binding NtrC family response regulator
VNDLARPPVLIVDDNEDLVENLTEILDDEGFASVGADSAESALEVLEMGPVSFVLTDQRMPGMSGVDLLSVIRKRWPTLPVAMMTGHMKDVDTDRARREGALWVFQKPIEHDALLQLLSRVKSD